MAEWSFSLPPLFWICTAYLVFVLVLGLVPTMRASPSVAGYVAGDRAVSTFVLYFLLGSAIFSAFAFLGMPGWAYSRGAAAFFIVAYGALGLIPMYFMGPKTRRLGQRFGFVTQAELVAWRFDNRWISVLLALLSVVAFIPYLTIQMTGAGYILEFASGGAVSMTVAILLTYGVVTLYVVVGGMMGVGWTGVLYGAVMMAVAWTLGLYLPHKLYGGIEPMFRAIEAAGHGAMLVPPGLAEDGSPWNWWAYSSAILVSVLGFSCWPHFFMKAFAARSDLAMKKIVVLYPTFQLFLIPIILIGMAAIVAFPGVKPADAVVPYLLVNADLSPVFAAVVFVGVLAASMSTGDAILHAAAAVFVRDGVQPLLPRRLTDAVERQAIRVMVILIALIAFALAISSDVSLVGLLLASYGGVAQMFPVLFATFYVRSVTGAGVVAGLATGIAVNVLFLQAPELRPVPLHEGIYGLVANVLVMALVSAYTRRPPADRITACVEERWD